MFPFASYLPADFFGIGNCENGAALALFCAVLPSAIWKRYRFEIVLKGTGSVFCLALVEAFVEAEADVMTYPLYGYFQVDQVDHGLRLLSFEFGLCPLAWLLKRHRRKP